MHSPTAHIPLTDDQRRRIAALAERLEEAWGAAGPAALGPLLPPADDPLRAAALRELVKTDLEIRYRRGLAAALDQLPDGIARTGRRSDDALAELLYEEYRVRQRHGDRPPLESYQARFPRPVRRAPPARPRRPRAHPAGPAPTPAAPAGVSVSGAVHGKQPCAADRRRLRPRKPHRPRRLRRGLARRRPGGVLVAVKIIRRPADHEERIREERALEVVKQLHHHFLARTHQYHSDKESLFIVMELADCSLRDRLARGAEGRQRGPADRGAGAAVPRGGRGARLPARQGGAAPRHQAGQHPARWRATSGWRTSAWPACRSSR